jgi:hypothetical protein
MGRSVGPRIAHEGWAVLPKGRSRTARQRYAARAGVALDALDVDPMAPSGEPVREFERDRLAALTLDPGGTGNSLSAEDFIRLRGRLMVEVSDRTSWWDIRPYTGPSLACLDHQRAAGRSGGADESRSAEAPGSAALGTSGSEATADDVAEPAGDSAPAGSDSDPSIGDQQPPAVEVDKARGKGNRRHAMPERPSPQRRNRHPRENRMHRKGLPADQRVSDPAIGRWLSEMTTAAGGPAPSAARQWADEQAGRFEEISEPDVEAPTTGEMSPERPPDPGDRDFDDVAGSHAISRAGWTAAEHAAGHLDWSRREGEGPPDDLPPDPCECPECPPSPPPEVVLPPEEIRAQAATAITMAARRKLAKQTARQEVAADTIARVFRKRSETRRRYAALLIQWIWRRRHVRGVKVGFCRRKPRCCYGDDPSRNAGPADFARQKRDADAVLVHWRQYVTIFRRLFRRSPVILDLFCSEGGASEGIRRAGCIPRGMDLRSVRKYIDRFGADSFFEGDATRESEVFRMGFADGIHCSPPVRARVPSPTRVEASPRAGSPDFSRRFAGC